MPSTLLRNIIDNQTNNRFPAMNFSQLSKCRRISTSTCEQLSASKQSRRYSLHCVAETHPTLGHSIHVQHRDPRTLSIKGPAHNRRCTVGCAEQSHLSGPPNDFRQRRNLPLKQPILHSSHHTSKWPNINPHGDSRQQAFAKTRAKRSS
jgi:hypothetical protein